MLFHFGDTVAEIDAEATRNYYLNHNFTNDCVCLGCQNFRQWIKFCPPEVREQFQTMGIDDLNWIAEIIPFGTKPEDYKIHNGMLYGGFYHVVGRIIENGKNSDRKLSENFGIFIPEYTSPSLPDFPEPVLQIEICAYIPWVIAASMENYIN
ncbi:MAG: hypothetical protein IJJ69_13450 [Oscillospiraceae bacterium]|nr:hypothetical protein [Oscillospiraceae bacterium]